MLRYYAKNYVEIPRLKKRKNVMKYSVLSQSKSISGQSQCRIETWKNVSFHCIIIEKILQNMHLQREQFNMTSTQYTNSASAWEAYGLSMVEGSHVMRSECRQKFTPPAIRVLKIATCTQLSAGVEMPMRITCCVARMKNVHGVTPMQRIIPGNSDLLYTSNLESSWDIRTIVISWTWTQAVHEFGPTAAHGRQF